MAANRASKSLPPQTPAVPGTGIIAADVPGDQIYGLCVRAFKFNTLPALQSRLRAMATDVRMDVQISGLGIAGGIQTDQGASPPLDPVTMPGKSHTASS